MAGAGAAVVEYSCKGAGARRLLPPRGKEHDHDRPNQRRTHFAGAGHPEILRAAAAAVNQSHRPHLLRGGAEASFGHYGGVRFRQDHAAQLHLHHRHPSQAAISWWRAGTLTALHGGELAAFRGRKLGFIFQDFNLLDTLTARENIALTLFGVGRAPGRDRAPGGADRRRAGHRRRAGQVPLPDVRRAAAAGGRGAGGGHRPGRWCWPTSPPARWTPIPPACC